MRTLKIVLFGIQAVALGLLLGCGGKKWFHDRSKDYVDAKPEPALKIPAKMDTEAFSEEYQIPNTKSAAKTNR